MAGDELSEEKIRREVVDRARMRIEDVQARQRLIEAVCRIPQAARELALDRCFFVAIGGDTGSFQISPEPRSTDSAEPLALVVLNSGWSDLDFQSAVAHEIAHLWLGHSGAELGPDAERLENEAAEQVRAWGFSGIGSRPFHRRP